MVGKEEESKKDLGYLVRYGCLFNNYYYKNAWNLWFKYIGGGYFGDMWTNMMTFH